MVWHSPNASDWAPIVFVDEDACTEASIADVTATQQGFLAVGTCDNRAGVWVSDTGANWHLISTQHPVFTGEPQVVLSTEKGVVVVGSESVIWTTTDLP